ncbi:MAG: ABC transporter permease [Candidatus Marinimicrobia bacterium]|nr:ABC transporter permease [Candidatus Neomarinimicrobiota bacterium]
MIKQMFKLIWNRKRRNFLMMIGIFISFFALFLVMTTINYNIGNYLKPLGFDYRNVWYISMDWKNQSKEEITTTMRQVERALESIPEIEQFTYSRSYLFAPAVMSMDDITYQGKTVSAHLMESGDEFANLLKMDLVAGRWFDKRDNVSVRRPVVINRDLNEKLFGDIDPVGVIFERDDKEYEVIGLVDEFRNSGQLTGTKKVMFVRVEIDDADGWDEFASSEFGRLLIRVKPGADIQLEERILKQLSSVARDWSLKLSRLEDVRSSANRTSMIIPIILAIICGFLIINVALGLFGIIWYNTNRRKAEIGLRRAMGSTVKQIYSQIIGEALVLSIFGIGIGLFFAIQFPLLGLIPFISNATYFVSIIISILAIIGITALCALYPSALAANLQPAIALHDE